MFNGARKVVVVLLFATLSGITSLALAAHGHGGGGHGGGHGWSGGHGGGGHGWSGGHGSIGHYGGHGGFNHWGGGGRYYAGHSHYYRYPYSYYRPYRYFAYPYLSGYYGYPSSYFGYGYPYYYSYPNDYYTYGDDYYADAPQYYDYSPPQQYITSRPIADVARMEVRLPDPDGTLWVQGQQMTSTGSVRHFRSPPLDPSQQYTYNVKAQWNDNGKLVTDQRQVKVQANALAVVDFTHPASTTGHTQDATMPPLPPPARQGTD